ncbi:MAG: acyltransferase family protein [Anaerolineales bacterium]
MSSLHLNRLRWADLIRAFGAFLVVVAHVEYHGGGSPLVRDVYYALTRAAVPLFFMASGYFLLSKQEPLLDFFRKRALKVFVPFLIWSVIYLLWKREALDESIFAIVKTYALKIIRGPREAHLWFFYELFGLYLFVPVLRVYLETAGEKDLRYFLVAWLILIPGMIALQTFTPIKIGFTYYFLGGYIGYFLFGYWAGKEPRLSKPAAWSLFAFFWALTVVGMQLNRIYGLKTQYFEDYLSLNVVLMAGAFFLALQDFPVSDSLYRLVAPLSRASFGIYLAHVIVMAGLFQHTPLAALTDIGANFYMTPLIALIGFAATFALVWALQKIPLLKNIVP